MSDSELKAHGGWQVLILFIPFIAYGTAFCIWLACHGHSETYTFMEHGGELQIQYSLLGYLPSGFLLIAALFCLIVSAMRTHHDDSASSKRTFLNGHIIPVLFGVFGLMDCQASSLHLSPNKGELRNGLFSSHWEFTPADLKQPVRLQNHANVGVIFRVRLTLNDGRTAVLPWPGGMQTAIIEHLEQKWEVRVEGTK